MKTEILVDSCLSSSKVWLNFHHTSVIFCLVSYSKIQIFEIIVKEKTNKITKSEVNCELCAISPIE